jgi:hypothetical protein
LVHTNSAVRTVDQYIGFALETSVKIRDVLFLSRAGCCQADNIGAKIVVGPSTTDMSLNTAITTISDSNSGRFAVGSDGIDA